MKLTPHFLAIVVLLTSPSVTTATDGDKDRIPPLAQAGKSDRPTKQEEAKQREGEQRTLEFVGQHQPELLELLEFMKKKQPSQYQQALREMARTQQRLEGLALRDKELHAVELELWNIRSKLRLIAARIPVVQEKKREALREELEQLVAQEVDQNLAKLKIQRARTETQLANINKQITRSETELDQVVAAALKSWNNRIAKQMPRKRKKSDKSAAQAKDKESEPQQPTK